MTEEVDDGDGLTYSEAGVDIEESEAATEALVAALGPFDTDTYAGLLDVGDRYLALATDGVGTKLLVADAIGEYATIGIDCIAMNVNDLVAMGVHPVGFVDYLAVEEPDEALAEAIGVGLAAGAERGDVALLGGETAVLPEIISGIDLAGTAVGISRHSEVFDGEAAPGDFLVGFPASGIHSNGLTLAREAVTGEHEYADPFPPDNDRSIGEVLLEPTAIYTDLLSPLRDHDTRAAAHITGGGWTNLNRMGNRRYVIDKPWPRPAIFEFIQEQGGVSDEEMHRTFNMGTGFVASVPDARAEALAAVTGGRVIGRVESGSAVEIRGVSL